VAAERAAIEGGGHAHDTPIQIFSLRKVYAGGKVAINNLTFAIRNDECFGLLGPNGAGKSTTISVLTGLFRPTSGTATIGGHDILTNMPDIYRTMGVCPQFDILWPSLTVREHMLFYCRLKGVGPKHERATAEASAGAVGLGSKLDKRVATLSGGQKRRVSLGTSLIGNPKIIFLDEPTTGLDPETKRLMWQLIERSKAGRVIVLTTHSMDEADALCGRIGIMANGELRCVGSNVHLKTALGDGYKLDVANEPGAEAAAHAFMTALLPTAEVVASFATSKTYAVRRAGTSIATVFEQMSKRPASAGIIDWGLRQTSLEEVFLKIAREATEAAGGAKQAAQR
jgi:ABC-type multidrug transport system ATPase subunit